MTGKPFAAVLGAVLLLLAAGGVYAVRPDKAHGGSQPAQQITVSGTGTVTTTPDRANFSFGVSTDKQTAKNAIAATSRKMLRVLNALEAAGVQARDIQTQQISVWPNYVNSTFVGFTASNSVVVKIRNLDAAGPVIDAAVGAGATSVWGPELFRSDQQQIARNALRDAVSDARAKAQALAAASGSSVGRIVSVIEHGAIAPSGGGVTGIGGGVAITAPAPIPPPVRAGEQSVQATVTVTFETQ